MKKVVIIDDEVAGRTLIKQYLSEYPTLLVVGEAHNGVDAIKIINEFKPDLIFLDIQMPGMTGFEILGHLEEIPQIIFSTAYDKYALQAFEVHAVDYLLKPYTRERFKQSIQRVRTDSQPNPVQPLAESLMLKTETYPERVLVNVGQKLINVAVSSIIWIEADGDYSKLITQNSKYLSNYGISTLENKLNPNQFIRVHRSSIIHLTYLKEVQKYISSYDVIMQNGDVVRVSRGYMDNLKKLIY
ncbi:MAG: response regulator transcription factor [Saprospiraceae bacterium]|nr:response regulator transcription factor [Saprospiraceae bacterium]